MGIIEKALTKINPTRPYRSISYSQEGEDLVLNRLIGYKSNGFYVDVGAHHPFRFSNTYFFYLRGWRGINIDPLPNSKLLFDKYRPNDINLELGISRKKESLTYYMFNEPALNTFNKQEAELKIAQGNFFLREKKEIKTYPMEFILDQQLPKEKEIDFISIDAEGLDIEILHSNNWEKYRPSFVLVEDLRQSIETTVRNSEVHKLMKSLNYQLIARTLNTSFYQNCQ